MELRDWLNEQGIWHEMFNREDGLSAESAAKNIGVPVELFAKSLIILDDKRNPYKVLVPGDKKLSFKKLKAVLGVKRVRMCPFDEAKNYSGFVPGATAPVYHATPLQVVLDSVFSDREFLYGGGGKRTLTVKLRVSDVIHVNNALIADISE